jgi:putative intracellular protease/amidase
MRTAITAKATQPTAATSHSTFLACRGRAATVLPGRRVTALPPGRRVATLPPLWVP